ncbi:MAG: type II toxin-antitoxin system Phd/YefM family antitoxin [Oscillospiraceae bacterium]|nr:type II toxin-antitoxin system Phd/YefM family antitoxin [Oscillospiraceae bacterium]
MINPMVLSSAMDALVPLSRFNKGEAGKIFDEVRKSGFKIVVKNNVPAGVVLAPEYYKAMVEHIDEMHLYSLVAERLANDTGITYTNEQVMAELGITQDEIDAMDDVELEYELED